jgi:hypothetical protein
VSLQGNACADSSFTKTPSLPASPARSVGHARRPSDRHGGDAVGASRAAPAAALGSASSPRGPWRGGGHNCQRRSGGSRCRSGAARSDAARLRVQCGPRGRTWLEGGAAIGAVVVERGVSWRRRRRPPRRTTCCKGAALVRHRPEARALERHARTAVPLPRSSATQRTRALHVSMQQRRNLTQRGGCENERCLSSVCRPRRRARSRCLAASAAPSHCCVIHPLFCPPISINAATRRHKAHALAPPCVCVTLLARLTPAARGSAMQ